MEATTAKNVPFDLKLRVIGGGGVDGALGVTELEALILFLQGASSQDPSLVNLSLVGVKKGSKVAILKALPHDGIPGLTSPTHAIAEIFRRRRHRKGEPMELPSGVIGALKVLTRGGAKVEITYRSAESLKPRRVTFDQDNLSTARPKRVKTYIESTFVGRLVRLHSDEENFGVETIHGLLVCPFPPHERESWVALYERTVSVTAKVPPRPASGPWRAIETSRIQVQPDPPALNFDDDIPGLVPLKLARREGFSLDDLFPGLTPDDADSLTDFLTEYRER
ncbi:MAG: hypothetical protein HGA66_10160 [Holophaga sp.]|nr:hypothetical protein [Holophaga sp.]